MASHAQPVASRTSVSWASHPDFQCCVRSCKPIAGGHINVTDQHALISTYGGKDSVLLDAIADVTAGGWRNDVSTPYLRQWSPVPELTATHGQLLSP